MIRTRADRLLISHNPPLSKVDVAPNIIIEFLKF